VHEGTQTTDLREKEHFKRTEECHTIDNDGAEHEAKIWPEVCFEFADVSKVKHEVQEKERSAQNEEENNEAVSNLKNDKEQENLPQMGFVHCIISNIFSVIETYQQ
jgi:hypothetical protein